MGCLPDADTVGNEDEIGSTCLKLMWMDGVRGDEELRSAEAAAGARRWAAVGAKRPTPALPRAVTPVTRPEVDGGGGPGFDDL